MTRGSDEAKQVLQLARNAADKEAATPINHFHALGNVAADAEKVLPEFSEDCLRGAVAVIDKMEPEDRVVAHLSVIGSASRKWPVPYVQTIWRVLAADLDRVPWAKPDKKKVMAAVVEIGDRQLARAAWRQIARALLAPKIESWWHHDEELAQAALALARLDAGDDANALLDHLEWRRQQEGYDDFKTEAYVAAVDHRLQHPGSPTRLRALLDKLKQKANSSDEWEPSISAAVQILAADYDGIAKDEDSFRSLLEICAAIKDLRSRSLALQFVIDAAVESQDFEKAASLLTRISVARLQAESVDGLAGLFIEQEREGIDSSAFWQNLIEGAAQSVYGSLACANAWTKRFLRDKTTPEAVDEGVAAVLDEIDFADRYKGFLLQKIS
jgi:hypothetical protein